MLLGEAAMSVDGSGITKRKVLVVDDEKEIVKLLVFHLHLNGYDTAVASDGRQALELARTEHIDLMILDLMIPLLDGYEVCRLMKDDPHTRRIPVIMLTACAQTEDKLRGFNVGADDYVVKPFSVRELIARVKRVMERSLEGEASSCKLRLDPDASIVLNGTERICLTEKERKILEMFLRNPRRVFTHEEILDIVWGQEVAVEQGNIDVHISHLREKLAQGSSPACYIRTIKGKGYAFEPEATVSGEK
jgi:two-component system alkaline phosphatase synthesis response regulator PhoP